VEFGNIIADCFNKVGRHGIVKLRKSDSPKTYVELIEGIQIERGYLSSDFVTSHESTSWIFENCRILIYPDIISSHIEILPIMDKIAKSGFPILILAKDVRDSALETILLNVQKDVIKAVVVRVPEVKDHSISILEDISIKTGGKIVSAIRGIKLSHVQIEDLGVADKVIVTNDYTRIIGGEGCIEEIAKRTKKIDAALESTKDIYESQKYRDQLAMLMGATAIVNVGGVTSQEADENLYGYYSALNSSQSAISYGALPGGALHLYLAKEKVLKIPAENKGEESGIKAVLESLDVPIVSLISNANLDSEQVLDKIRSYQSNSIGFNSEKGIIEDLIKAKIIDPADLIIKALEIALSHSKMFLETTMWADQKSLDT